jgi:glutathione S-transferase
MITLYDMDISGNAQKVRIALALLGLDYARETPDGAARGTDAYRALHPLGQVPVLVDGDIALRDSHAILVYLAAKHRPGDWDGTTPAEKAEIAVWLAHSASEIAHGPALLRVANLFNLAIDRTRPQQITDRILPLVEAHLASRDWLVGDRLTIADIAAAPYLALAREGDVDLDAYPNIVAWTQRLAALPAFPAMPGWARANAAAGAAA